jgi:hypothetical protein
LPVLVQQVTELVIHFFKFAPNGKIIYHSKKKDELVIKNTMVQTHSMCSVLELDRGHYRMVTNCPEARDFRMAMEFLEFRKNLIRGEGNVRVPFCPPI